MSETLPAAATPLQEAFVRLRGEYNYLKDLGTGKAENRFSLQLTWAAGPHKHETY